MLDLNQPYYLSYSIFSNLILIQVLIPGLYLVLDVLSAHRDIRTLIRLLMWTLLRVNTEFSPLSRISDRVKEGGSS